MKRLLLSLFVTGAFTANAQDIKEWLSLTPVKIEMPALSEVKNVKDKIFTEAMFTDYMNINIQDFTPDANQTENRFRHLRWTVATSEQDTVTAPQENEDYTLNYYAVYLSNKEWMTGKLNFKIFGKAEIYVDGTKKATSTDSQASNKSIAMEWIPGKHTIIVKSITRGGKVVFATFQADKKFENSPVAFTTSPKHGKTIYEVLNGKRTSQLSVSPGGKYAIVEITNTVDGKTISNTYIYRIADQEIVYTFYENNVSQLQWIPGTEQLSFLQSEGTGKSLYSYDIEKQQQTCLIREDRQIKNYTWSPDRSYLIYTDREDFSDPKWELRKLDGIQDRQDYFRNRFYLCQYNFATGLHSRLTWGNLSTSLMDISRDGKKLLFSTHQPVDNEYPYSKQSIYLMDVTSRKLDTLWKDRRFSISCSFSPDGQQLLVSGGPSAFGQLGENIGKNPIANQYDNQLYIYDLSNRKAKAITRDFNPSVEDVVWHKNGKIYLKTSDADFVRLYCYDNGKITPIHCPGDMILQMSLANDAQQMMYTASTTNYPPCIYTLDLTNEKATLWEDPNREQYKNVVFGEMKDWDYQYKKGTVIDGRYYLPADFDPSKKYPLIVYYYGGTTPVSRSFGGRWPFNLYAANGYVVYVLQPSGAIGYGQEFSARHQNNWCKITADEIIASTKAFVKEHPFINASKVGCMGASYGGFTTEYLTTQTDFFACAISHAGISSISSYWGGGYWGYQYSTNATAHAFPWNRRDIYVDQSPLFNADKVKVPILLIHGTKDVNVPTNESIQFYTALRLLGKDTELVFVKDSDHAVVDYNQRILWNNTILSYFAKYLKEQPAWWENQYKDLNL
ncbi:MAG: prolyl oligopeptidase family serine peptidase [Odoribacter sp.]